MGFKADHTFEKRQKEASDIRTRQPDRVPVICEKGESSSIPQIDKIKFLVPSDLTTGQFLYVIRKRMNMSSSQALFVLTERGTMPPTSATIMEIYSKDKAEDGFLYLVYTGENTFGLCSY